MTKILAVMDPEESKQHALERCRQQSPDQHLEIHAVLFIEHESAANAATAFQEKTQWLQQQVAPYIDEGFNVTTEVIRFSSLHEAITDAANKQDADFVVKPLRQHSLFQTVVRTSTDWNLIRHCQHPLLLVSDLDSTRTKPVLAAIDANSGDANHDTLNHVVMKQALRLAEVLGSDTHVVNTYLTRTQLATVGAIDPTPIPTAAEIKREHAEKVSAFLSGTTDGAPQTHIEEGTSADAITNVARKIDAGVIVIGTVARTGISGVLIGNTAEAVLEATQCDVLVVKLPT